MNRKTIDRREFLRRGSIAAAAGAALPLLGPALQASPASAASAAPPDPDQLFQAGLFDAADRGYARALQQDPDDAHALAQRGYIALLSNRFGAAESFLANALQLTPDDPFTLGQLADCYVRQDNFASAVPLLNRSGATPAAAQYAALPEAAYQVLGPESTRVPIVQIDPLPVIEASLNGGAPQRFYFDTGAGTATFSQEIADELGLTPVATATGTVGGGVQVILNYGVLESLRIGGIEVRNLPVLWSPDAQGPVTTPQPVGAIGTVLFYHFLTTLDYQGLGFILRRRSEAGLRAFQAAARRHGYRPLPLWLADTHFPCTLGSLNDFGPHVVSMDTGGPGVGIVVTDQVAQEADIPVDDQDPVLFLGALRPSVSPDRIALGDAVGTHVPGAVVPPGLTVGSTGPLAFGFQTIGNFTHEFFKPFAVTFDYLEMNLYVTPTVPDC
ncbi:MAG TPA: aspartyl protease family protein [Actinocrinis sp.]|jgi:tetratricopeptide (TPR) repeat protein